MKRCSYCGAEYPDEMSECPVDHESVVLSVPSPQQMSRDKPKRAVRVRGWIIRLILLFACVNALACGMFGVFAIRDGLRTGRVYSLAIVLGSGAQVYRDTSPTAYWFIIGFYVFGALAGISLGLATSVGQIIRWIKARQTKGEIASVQS